jgi:hypothetical protein
MKPILNIMSVCLFVPYIPGIQSTYFLRSIIFPSVLCLAAPQFSTLSHKLHDFRKQCIEHNMCALIFCTTSVETFLILRRNKRNTIINVHMFSCKVLFFVRFQ